MAHTDKALVLPAPGIDWRRILIAAAIPVIVVGILVTLFVVVGFTPAPFDQRGELAVGRTENSLGDQYTLSAANLTSTWTLTRDADIVLEVGGGVVTVDGQRLAAGCYSGLAASGTVIAFDDAENVSFTSPASDASCAGLP